MKKKYEVLNPRGVPSNVQVLSIGDNVYYFGEQVTLDDKLAAPLVDRGILKEIKRGK